MGAQRKAVRRTFPGPEQTGEGLRVHFSRRSYADLVAHAKESLEAEVGGVLVGEVCEDAEGEFVDIRAIIRATAAREARAHITFTHDTWTAIHAALDRDHPDLQIVGWYHTHPGFGVEFSAMDRFIQENFFSSRTQIAFLTDPLGGDTALCGNGLKGIEPIGRFWVDGREHVAKIAGQRATEAQTTPGAGPDWRGEFERLERRMNQLVGALDEQRRNFNRMLTTVTVVACTAIVLWVAYAIWADRYERVKPPRVQSYIPVPIRVGGETIMLGVGVVDWKVPPRLDALVQEAAKLEREAQLERQIRAAEQKQQLQKKKD